MSAQGESGVSSAGASTAPTPSSITVNSHEAFEQRVVVTIVDHGKDPTDDALMRARLRFENRTAQAVTVEGLTQKGALQVVDLQDTRHPTRLRGSQPVVVPAKGATELVLSAELDPRAAFSIRVWGKDYKLRP